MTDVQVRCIPKGDAISLIRKQKRNPVLCFFCGEDESDRKHNFFFLDNSRHCSGRDIPLLFMDIGNLDNAFL